MGLIAVHAGRDIGRSTISRGLEIKRRTDCGTARVKWVWRNATRDDTAMREIERRVDAGQGATFDGWTRDERRDGPGMVIQRDEGVQFSRQAAQSSAGK
jgi:hypothetical protein